MRIGIIGLGYVGLPLAVAFAEAGCEVVGLDVDEAKVAALNAGESYIEDVPSSSLAPLAEKLGATGGYGELAGCDAVILCVPTPLSDSREPDLGPLEASATALAQVLRSGQLVVLESTTYPGTTRELVGGVTEASTERARALYAEICDTVIVLSSPEAAELSKLLENIFRSVNIALVNELSQLCDRLEIDVWEVIEAASSKPFGFMRFDPGPGMGGHCLPVDPFYLAFRARQLDFYPEFIELAGKVNQAQPSFCVERIERALNGVRKPVNGSRVLILGVSYKGGVGDTRESPALKIVGRLQDLGAEVSYHDSFVPELPGHGLSSVELDGALRECDLAAIVTAHPDVDYEAVVATAPLVVDFRGVTRGIEADNLVRL